jgi:hypothetical protein
LLPPGLKRGCQLMGHHFDAISYQEVRPTKTSKPDALKRASILAILSVRF